MSDDKDEEKTVAKADRALRGVTTSDGRPPDAGLEDAAAPGALGSGGQHRSYWVLSESERARGFVRPVRRSYRHVGRPGPAPGTLRDLTAEEEARHLGRGYDKYEEFRVAEGSVVGRFWTRAQLDSVGRGCGQVTTMGPAIAETYARQPDFYGSTFCAHCGAHKPVGADGEFVWATDVGPDGDRVGT